MRCCCAGQKLFCDGASKGIDLGLVLGGQILGSFHAAQQQGRLQLEMQRVQETAQDKQVGFEKALAAQTGGTEQDIGWAAG